MAMVASVSRPGMTTKGSVIRATIGYLRDIHGGEILERTLADLDPDTRTGCESVGVTDELPYAIACALWESAHRALGAPPDMKWMEAAGAYSIEQTGVQQYSGIVRKRSPSEFLTQSVSLFQLYYHPGDMQVVYEAPGCAVLRLVGFDAGTSLFCARQTGGLRGAILVARGGEPRVRHVRCEFEQDAYCEWELRWTETG